MKSRMRTTWRQRPRRLAGDTMIALPPIVLALKRGAEGCLSSSSLSYQKSRSTTLPTRSRQPINHRQFRIGGLVCVRVRALSPTDPPSLSPPEGGDRVLRSHPIRASSRACLRTRCLPFLQNGSAMCRPRRNSSLPHPCMTKAEPGGGTGTVRAMSRRLEAGSRFKASYIHVDCDIGCRSHPCTSYPY